MQKKEIKEKMTLRIRYCETILVEFSMPIEEGGGGGNKVSIEGEKAFQ